MVEDGLIFARFLHYAATTVLAGLSFFPLYAYARAEPEALGHWRRRLFLWAAIVALLSGLCWFAFATANMSGDIGDLVDTEMLSAVVRDTSFGMVWILRMLLAVVIVGAAASDFRSKEAVRYRNPMMSFLVAVLLVSLAWTGHTQIEEGWAGVIHVISDAAHLLAAGAWLGGLIPLAVILHRSARANPNVGSKEINQILMRFSGMGYIAVATLIGSGLINSWFLVGSVPGLLKTLYGQILLGKLALFGGMLLLAVANRFWLVPSMSKIGPDATNRSAAWSARLRSHVLGEQFLGWAVLVAVSILGTMQPSVGQ